MSGVLLVIYCVAVFGAGLIGGWLPRRFAMTHTRTQLTMSFVSGMMLGVAFFHLIPHSATGAAVSIDFSMAWVMTGLIFMLMLLRLFHFHQHEFVAVELTTEDAAIVQHEHSHTPSHSHSHAQDHCSDAAHAAPHVHESHPDTLTATSNSLTWVALLLGLSLHTVVDGIALGAVLSATAMEDHGILGLGVFLAIFLHKPLDALSIETVMSAANQSRGLRHWVNLGFALLCPAVALLFWLFVEPSADGGRLLPGALAFSAGAFICIALSDLLPEVQFHSHDRVKLTVLFLLGIGLAWAIGSLEPAHGVLHS